MAKVSTGKTKKTSIAVDEDLWALAKAKAAKRKQSLSLVVSQLLREWVREG